MFFRFVRACKKYNFTFVLSTYGGISLILRPNNTFENIELKEYCYNLNKILLEGIKVMKKYRKENSY